MKLTTVLFVDAIEPSLPFWREGLGFTLTVEVPHEDKLGFVILTLDTIEIMLQIWDSVRSDFPDFGSEPKGMNCSLFFERDDFEAAAARLANYPVRIPDRTTFYGMREIGYTAPSGHIVVIAVRLPQTPTAN